MDDRPYFYRAFGRRQGPHALSHMRMVAKRAQINGFTPVSRDGHEWGKGEDWPEIFGSDAPPPGPPELEPPELEPPERQPQEPFRPIIIEPRPVHGEGANGTAIAGFVVSLVCCAPLGLILSLVALNSQNQANRGLAIAGAIIGGLITFIQLCVLVVYIIGFIAFATSARGVF